MTRLLYVFNIPGFFVNQRLHLAEAAREEGYEVHVATSETGPEARIKAAGFPFHPLQMDRKGLRPWEEVPTMKGLYDLYRRLRPDLIENATIKPVLYGGLAAHLFDAPPVVNWITGLGHIFTDSSFRARILRRLVEFGYRGALAHEQTFTIFKNPDDQRLFVEAGLVKQDRTVVIRGAGVDVDKFRPAEVEAGGPPLVVMVCRMLWPKGVKVFVEAAQLLCREGVDARFALVGDADPGNPQSVPRERLRQWQEDGSVEWWGYRDDVSEVLQQASLFCLPSYYREGVPMALLEAAATGLPLVTTDAPGCRETVVDGRNGLLVPPQDSKALASALARLLRSPRMRSEMRRESRRVAEELFSKEKIVKETLAIYERALTVSSKS